MHDSCFIDAHEMQTWHLPVVKKNERTAGIDINNLRNRAIMESLIALSINPAGITTPRLAKAVCERIKIKNYSTRHAAYDLKKFRAKNIVVKTAIGKRSYRVTPDGLRAMTAFLTIRDKVIIPVLNRACKLKRGPKLSAQSQEDIHYENIQKELHQLFKHYKIAA